MRLLHPMQTGSPQLFGRDTAVGADNIGRLSEDASHEDKPEQEISRAHSASLASR
jgi:hypothetical protein